MSLGKIDLPLEKLADERLGLGAHIKALTKFICQCDTPMTIAIQGDWGTGKTSFMQVVEKELQEGDNKGKYATVKFNTWQFSQFDLQDDVPVVLLMELLRAFGCEESKVKKFLVGSLKKAGGVIGAIMGGAEGREAMKQLLESDPTNMVTQIRELKNELNNAVESKRSKEKIDRIVVFIDDLDRMNPGKAVGLLEIIKNFLDISGCVYVIAVDYGVVSRGVREKYGQDMDELKGRSFFDKIIQLPFNLPVAQYEIEKYLKELFILEDAEAKIYKKLAESSVGTNPRSLKRMANTLKLIELVAVEKSQFDKERETEFKRALFASLCLQMAFEPVYAQILGSGEYMDFLKDLENNPQTVLDKFKDAVQKIPGKPEIVERRLKNYLKALDESIPMIGEEKNYDLFDAVMRLSGVTASGAQTEEEKANQQKSFDPNLMKRLKGLCKAIRDEYSSFFSMIDEEPTDGGDEGNEVYVPVIWGEDVNYILTLGKESIERYFSTCSDDSELRGMYRDVIEKVVYPQFPNMTKSRGRNSRVLSKLPTISWNAEPSEKSIRATHTRYEQVSDILHKDCAIIIPAFEEEFRPSSPALDATHGFLVKIKDSLKNIFHDDAWEIEIQNKGYILYKNVQALTIRKLDWLDDVFLYICSWTGNGQKMTFSFYYEGATTHKKSDIKKIVDGLKEKGGSIGINKVSLADEDFGVVIDLPSELADWLEGSIFEGNLKYLLNTQQEKSIISFIENCSKVFLSIEATLDSIATD